MARILLIEDDTNLREVLAVTLVNAGHIVAQAVDGRQGVELFDLAPVELVITDILMPGQEGIETIMQLQRREPGLPIIAISGGATHSKFYLGMAAKLGAQQVLAKPFTPAELLRAVGTVLATRQAPHPTPP